MTSPPAPARPLAPPAPPGPAAAGRTAIRRTLRAQRAALSAGRRREAALRIARHLERLRLLRPGARVAIYAAFGGEVDTLPIAMAALRHRCTLFLPRITSVRAARMTFAPVAAPRRRLNAYGIPEPATAERIAPHWLDLVLLPVVAFDAAGTRLGMGLGYYDRALAFRRRRRAWSGPRIIGLAYAFQQCPELPRAAHDVPLDAVITERGSVVFPGKSPR
jgi:5-formyltetrahydrofolate cyclo-ligase